MKKFFALLSMLGMLCGASAWAATPTDPIMESTGGCVKSPLPSAPADAAAFVWDSKVQNPTATPSVYQMKVWFQPCTEPNATLKYPAVLLMEATPMPNTPLASTSRMRHDLELEQDGALSGIDVFVSYLGSSSSNNVAKPTTFLVRWLNTREGLYNVNPARPVAVYSSGSKSTVQLVPVVPTTSGSNAAIPAANFSGIWWNPAESGHGLLISQDKSNYLWLTWFTHSDSANQPVWYISSISNAWSTPTQMDGLLLHTQYNGESALTGIFDSNKIQQIVAGSFTLKFTDANHGTLTYTLNGKTLTKSIMKLALH